MEDATETRYWCHVCSRTVIPVIEGEIINCNFCLGGFVEEMDNAQDDPVTTDHHHQAADSLWAPILLEMMNNHHNHTNSEAIAEDEDDDGDDGDDDDDGDDENNDEENNGGEMGLSQQLEEIVRRRSRHSAAIVDLLQGIRAGLLIESEANEDTPGNSELVVLINSFNQRIRVHQDSVDTTNSVPSGSLGDYFIGPGFELLLERLAENDLNNKYGTPPAHKEAVEALEMVKIEESLQCSVCLDDFEIGIDAKEMPCKHKFHSDCLLPWLELHSSCPVCRFLLPTADDDGEPKTDADTLMNDDDDNGDISIVSVGSNGSSAS